MASNRMSGIPEAKATMDDFAKSLKPSKWPKNEFDGDYHKFVNR